MRNPLFCRKTPTPGTWAALLLLALGLALPAAAQTRIELKPEHFEENYRYVDNNRVGERLTVSFPKSPSEVTRSTEITIFEEMYFDRQRSSYDRRMVAVVTGMGMGTTGLKLVLDDRSQRNQVVSVLEAFIKADDTFHINRDVVESKTEEWMGEGWNALAAGRKLGSVYFYPSKKQLDTTFNWDLELNRVWLAMGSRIIIEREIVPFVLHLVKNADSYRNQLSALRNSLDKRNQEIDSLLRLSAK
jgi:hypothetical protein